MKETVTQRLVFIATAFLLIFNTSAARPGGLIAGFNSVAQPMAGSGASGACPKAFAAIDSVSPVCAGTEPFALSVSPAGGVLVGKGLDGPVFSPAAGTQTVYYAIVNEQGCADTAWRTIVVLPQPAVSFTLLPDTLCRTGEVIQLGGGFPAGGTFSGTGVSAGNQVVPSQPGSLRVTYAAAGANGCTGKAVQDVTVVDCPLSAAIADRPNSGLLLYPLPILSQVHIRFLAAAVGPATLSLTDVSGRQVWHGVHNAMQGENTTSVDVSALPRGIYLLSVQSSGEALRSQKLLLQ